MLWGAIKQNRFKPNSYNSSTMPHQASGRGMREKGDVFMCNERFVENIIKISKFITLPHTAEVDPM